MENVKNEIKPIPNFVTVNIFEYNFPSFFCVCVCIYIYIYIYIYILFPQIYQTYCFVNCSLIIIYKRFTISLNIPLKYDF